MKMFRKIDLFINRILHRNRANRRYLYLYLHLHLSVCLSINIHISTEIYYKELAYTITEAGKSKICRLSDGAGDLQRANVSV